MNDLNPVELSLAGYVPLTSRGFALPCFASGSTSNTWYTAICSVDTDHAGRITGFEVFESNDIIRLPAGSCRAVGLGSPWSDVFLWKGKPLVGTPTELWNALQDERDALLSAMPLSALDLALAIPSQDVTPLLNSAFEFMQTRIGAEKARTWRYVTLTEQQLLIRVRRHLFGEDSSYEPSYAIDAPRVVLIEDDRVSVELSPKLLDQCEARGRAVELRRCVNETVTRLGLDLIALSKRGEAEVQRSSPKANSSDTAKDATPESQETVRILILVSEGKRAAVVARHISSPEWVPDWLVHRRVVLDVDVPGLDIRRYVYPERPYEEPHDHGYDAVVVLTDDKALKEPSRSFVKRSNRNKAKVVLLAPILPEDSPSEILTGKIRQTHIGDIDFDAIVDTSVSRSPFWSGNPRRALDRRIADVVMGAAILCCGDTELRKIVTKAHDWMPLLSFALSKDDSKPHLTTGLISEIAGGYQNFDPKSGSSINFLAKFLSIAEDSYGIALVHDCTPNFSDFIESALSRIVSGFYPDAYPRAKVPSLIRRELVHPEFSVEYRTPKGFYEGIVFSAEAPTVKALQQADSVGRALVRYTDQESLEDLVSDQHLVQGYVPHEIRLPVLGKRRENRGWATRGVDPRDIIRLTRDDWSEWRTRLPHSIRNEIRNYRTWLGDPGESDPGPNVELVIPRRAIQEALESEEARELLEYFDPRASRIHVAGKRLADLRVLWSQPESGISRYIVSDGDVPCQFGVLDSEEVPSQRFFVIDGDAAVPALVGSRIFSVWAKATRTKSTSWMPRFSIGRTFETFPIVAPFVIDRTSEGLAQLRIEPKNRRMNALAGELRGLRRAHPSFQKLHHEIDDVILRALGMRPEASDLQILERLLSIADANYDLT